MEPAEARDEANLNEVSVGVLEALARGLRINHGTRTLEVIFTDGRYQRAFLKHGPIGRDELAEITA